MNCDGLIAVGKPLLTLLEEERTKKKVSEDQHKVSAQSHVVPCMYMYKKPLTLLMLLLQLIQGMEEKDRVVPK